MKTIYTAGAYSGDVAFNIARARYYAIALWEKGYAVICPHTNSAHFDEAKHGGNPKLGYELFCRGYLQLVSAADCLFLIPGWERSKGTQKELAAAILQGKEIFTPEMLGIPVPTSHHRFLQEKPDRKYRGGAEK